MNKFIILSIIIAFFALALTSPFAMAMEGHSDCIASAVEGGACPAAANILGIVAFHLDAVKHFSLATVSFDTILSTLLIAIVVLFLTKRKLLSPDDGQTLSVAGMVARRRLEHSTLAFFTIWINGSQALLEFSPVRIF